MRAINHALTGALLGLTISEPAIALPASFLSHFVCDAIPHHGDEREGVLESTSFKVALLIDIALCGLLVLILAIRRPQHWLTAAIAAFLATSPDFLWIPKYLYARAHPGKPVRPRGKLETLLGSDGIQWFQRPIGFVVEIAWFIGASVLLSVYVR